MYSGIPNSDVLIQGATDYKLPCIATFQARNGRLVLADCFLTFPTLRIPNIYLCFVKVPYSPLPSLSLLPRQQFGISSHQ